MKLVTRLCVIGSLTFLLFELCFRLYLIDFYGNEFKYLNANFKDRGGDKNLTIVGDSFSAFEKGYGQLIYDSLANYNVRNYSVSGTSVREQYLFGKHHIKREKPDILVFQFYLGNDLFSWNHHSPKGDISFLRNSYWQVSEHLWSLNFINHRLAGLRAKNELIKPDSSWYKEFNPEKFTKRALLYFKAEPNLVENAAYLKNGRSKDLKSYMNRMNQLFSHTDSKCKIYIVVVPHAAQVNKTYLERMKSLGAEFSSEFQTGQEQYPLFDQMVKFFSDDKRIHLLNPISILKESEDRGQAVYYKNDSHLTLEGQKVLGRFLLSHLKK